MRKDMDKVIVERPRVGHDNSYHYDRAKNKPKYFLDEEGIDNCSVKAAKMKPSLDGTFFLKKQLNENLSPLKRFLNSRVGKKWDDVYSEIRQTFSKNSTIQNHIFQHLKWFVLIGENCYKYGTYPFFVEDGILKKTERKTRNEIRKEVKFNYDLINNGKPAAYNDYSYGSVPATKPEQWHIFYARLDQVWYEIEVYDKDPVYSLKEYIHLYKKIFFSDRFYLMPGWPTKKVVKSYRSLSRKEIKKLGLNDVSPI